MSHNYVSAIFPLPLTVFENYLRLDDRPAYPMTIPVEIELQGEVLPAAFEAAWEEAIRRHPLFSCLLDTSTKPLPSWKYCPEARSPIDWGPLEAPRSCPNGEPIDLTRETGIRVWVRSGEGRTLVTLLGHHAVCDGAGFLRFIGDLFGAYSIRTAGPDAPPVKLPRVEADRLLRRGEFLFQPPEPVSRLRAVRATLREAFLWLWRCPAPLSAPQSSNESGFVPAPFPGMHFHLFSREESDRLRQAARHCEATLNDLLTRDIFLAVRDWNAHCGPQPSGRWLRVNMPVALRSSIHDDMPASDVMSYTFLSRRVADCDDPQRLLQSICWETDAIKRWNLGLYFIGGLTAAHKAPGLVRLFTNSRRCFCTVVHSHLGDIHRRFGIQFPKRDGQLMIGNLVLRRLTATPPIRPQTRAAFFTSRCGGQLSVALRCDPYLFSRDDGQRLLDGYIQRLRAAAVACGPSHIGV